MPLQPLDEDDRLLEICKSVSNEEDAEKLTKLIRELNRELDERLTSKKPETNPDAGAHRASHG
jgi:hypothetical protein